MQASPNAGCNPGGAKVSQGGANGIRAGSAAAGCAGRCAATGSMQPLYSAAPSDTAASAYVEWDATWGFCDVAGHTGALGKGECSARAELTAALACGLGAAGRVLRGRAMLHV